MCKCRYSPFIIYHQTVDGNRQGNRRHQFEGRTRNPSIGLSLEDVRCRTEGELLEGVYLFDREVSIQKSPRIYTLCFTLNPTTADAAIQSRQSSSGKNASSWHSSFLCFLLFSVKPITYSECTAMPRLCLCVILFNRRQQTHKGN